jgi:hypothetical protein
MSIVQEALAADGAVGVVQPGHLSLRFRKVLVSLSTRSIAQSAPLFCLFPDVRLWQIVLKKSDFSKADFLAETDCY